MFETSAKTGYNVEEVFTTVGKELYMQIKDEQERKEREKKEQEKKKSARLNMNTPDRKGQSPKKDIKLQPRRLDADLEEEGPGSKKKKCC